MSAKYSKKQLAELILEQKNDKARKSAVKAVAAYLVGSSRGKELESLIREIELVAQEQLSHASVHVSGAHKLSDNELDKIKRMVKDFSKTQSVEIDQTIDTSLIGGVVINTPDSEADLSVAGRLKRMKKRS